MFASFLQEASRELKLEVRGTDILQLVEVLVAWLLRHPKERETMSRTYTPPKQC